MNPTLWKQEADYPFPYYPSSIEKISSDLQRVLGWLENASPIRMTSIQGSTSKDFTSLTGMDLQQGPLRIISYELGVVYQGMINAYEATGDERFKRFCSDRLDAISKVAKHYTRIDPNDRPKRYGSKRLLEPSTLDHCGSMATAIIRAERKGILDEVDHLVAPTISYISDKQLRLPSGLLARDHPQKNTVWLDDLYMGAPTLAQLAIYTGNRSYLDDACQQVVEMTNLLFVPEKKLYRHSWIEGLQPQLNFHWGRANGWAILAMTDLLSILPEDHPKFSTILNIYRKHAAGILALQKTSGMWSQLLDKPETYDETSASAIFVYCFAKGVNEKWLNPLAFGPSASLGWNAVSQKIDVSGQLHDVCIATGIGWDPAYYAYRPTNPYAEHGYGPVLLAGAEMIKLSKNGSFTIESKNHAVKYSPKSANKGDSKQVEKTKITE